MCIECCDRLSAAAISSLGLHSCETLSEGITVCSLHKRETCDSCMMDYSLINSMHRDELKLGRKLSETEWLEKTKKSIEGLINPDVCILDGQPICKRTGEKLKCACREVIYCCTECQRHHWPIHKLTCAAKSKSKSTTASAHSTHNPAPPIVHLLEAHTIEELQHLVRDPNTPHGATIKLKPCHYQSDTPLSITRYVTLEGCGMNSNGTNTTLDCVVIIESSLPESPQQSTAAAGIGDSTVTIKQCCCVRGITINTTTHSRIQLLDLHISLPNAKSNFDNRIVCREDCVDVTNCSRLDITRCEIHGGSDGLSLNSHDINAYIKNTEIKYACCRGIFANPMFTIEDSEVTSCGSYGMKTRNGVRRRGRCNIQPGPWDGLA
jgi:hypothetical protein